MSSDNPKERRANSNAEKVDTLYTKNLVKYDKRQMVTNLRIICNLRACKVINGDYPIEFAKSAKPHFLYRWEYLVRPSELELKRFTTLRASKQVKENDLKRS
jgi:hypothetical protein